MSIKPQLVGWPPYHLTYALSMEDLTPTLASISFLNYLIFLVKLSIDTGLPGYL